MQNRHIFDAVKGEEIWPSPYTSTVWTSPLLLAFSRTVNCPSPYTVGLLPVVLDWWPSRYTVGLLPILLAFSLYCWPAPKYCWPSPYTVGLLPILLAFSHTVGLLPIYSWPSPYTVDPSPYMVDLIPIQLAVSLCC